MRLDRYRFQIFKIGVFVGCENKKNGNENKNCGNYLRIYVVKFAEAIKENGWDKSPW